MSGQAGKLPTISWPAGRYTVWQAHTPVAAVTVTGGQVSSCHWPG